MMDLPSGWADFGRVLRFLQDIEEYAARYNNLDGMKRAADAAIAEAHKAQQQAEMTKQAAEALLRQASAAASRAEETDALLVVRAAELAQREAALDASRIGD